MLHRLGFVASVLSESLSTSRTCRLRNATESRLRGLIEQNLASLDQVVSFLERQRIGLYRISSGLIPLASHPVNTVRWWKLYQNELAALGARLREGRIRVSMHPGQYTVLNSPNPAVVAASVAELAFHARLLDLLGTGTASKIVLHIGGQYGQSKEQAVERFTAVAEQLPQAVRRRLVVENDDRLFNAEHALEVSRRIGVPVVFDYLHHKANPAMRPVEGIVKAIFSTWRSEDGLPKMHLSTQADNAPLGAHADFVKPHDMFGLLAVAPAVPFDCMLEAKMKDLALLRLRADLAVAGIVERAAESVRETTARRR